MMTPAQLETAVVVLVDLPELDAIYSESYPVMAEQGVPLHLSLLYPFVPPEELPAALPRLGAVVAGHERFEFELTELRAFSDGYIWLAPEPAAPFPALTESIEKAFPDHKHWKGQFADVIPHATLAHVDEAELEASLARLRSRLGPILPVRIAADEATVLAGNGQWSVVARLPLGNVTKIVLRDVIDEDIGIFYEHQLDPVAVEMADFPSRERDEFERHWAKIRADPTMIQQTIEVDGEVAGNIGSWPGEEGRLVGYWIGREHWAKGVATAALREFLHEVTERPLFAFVAAGNVGSIRVLEKCGFVRVGEDEEGFVFRLDASAEPKRRAVP
jgi:RimJ/RimL family protein N-acetyltransferase